MINSDKPDSFTPDTELEYEKPTSISNKINYLIGFVFLILNKIRHELQGYTSARGFSSHLVDKAVAHDQNVITRWRDYLKKYSATDKPVFEGRRILELGPGADLGVGLFLLAEKAESYSAIDVHNLVKSTPPEIYVHLFETLRKSGLDDKVIKQLKAELENSKSNQNGSLDYKVNKDFDLAIFPDNNFDLIVSNAAFQQFDNPEKTISQLSQLMRPGAKFIALIDLKTHTRYINTKDPLNIYRYNDFIFRKLRFKGSPNRWRPYEYESELKLNGWTDIQIFPRLQLNMEYLKKVKQSLNEKFRDDKNQMQYLTVVICATKL